MCIKVCLSALDLSCLLIKVWCLHGDISSFISRNWFLISILSSRELAVLHTNWLLFPHLTIVFLSDKGVGGSTGFPGNYYDSATDLLWLCNWFFFKEAEAVKHFTWNPDVSPFTSNPSGLKLICYSLYIYWGFPCGSASKVSTCNVGDLGSIPEWGRSLGEGKGYFSILAWRIPWTV